MKIARLATFIVVLFSIQSIISQDLQLTKKDSIIESAWIVGLGLNAVDDAGSEFSNIFNVTDNWNIVPFPSRLNVGRYFKGGFGVELIGTYNQYQIGKTVDGLINTEEIDYFGIDVSVNYDLNQILGETGWFDPYVGIGVGYTDANNIGRGTYNASVGFRTWLTERFGLGFNSTGKWAMDTEKATNHLQHAAGVVYRFGIKRALSKKGEEKLAMIEEIEKEKQRVQDSIASAEKAAEEARLLAERLKQQEANRLAAEEKAKEDAEKEKRKTIEDAIKALGNVYFALNSSYLNKDDKALLDKLSIILQENPTLAISVASHTDARGTDKYNLWLSERRVQRTIDYLVAKGISAERIESQAFGETQLTNECVDGVYCPEEKHQQNRRSEFEVVRF